MLAKSDDTPGIQLADVLSSVGVAAANPSDSWSKEARACLVVLEMAQHLEIV
jgi:hypothetical protein